MNENAPIKSGITLLEVWENAKKDGISRKQFAESLGLTPKSLDNRLYKAKKKRKKQQREQPKKDVVTDVTEGNYRTLIATNVRHKSVDDLLKHLQVDLSVWQIDGKFEVGSWEQGRRAETKNLHWAGGRIEYGHAEDTGKLYIDTLHRFKVPLVRKVPLPVTPVVKPIHFTLNPIEPKPNLLTPIKSGLLIPDIQFGYRRNFDTGELTPYHCREALSIVLQVAQTHSFDFVVYLGDLLDLAEWTDKFVKEPAFYKTTQPSLIEASWFLAQIKNALPHAEHTRKPRSTI